MKKFVHGSVAYKVGRLSKALIIQNIMLEARIGQYLISGCDTENGQWDRKRAERMCVRAEVRIGMGG